MEIGNGFVGYKFPELTVEIDRTMIRRFAQAIGETDPVHFDEAAAKAAGYAALVAPLTFPIALKSLAFALPGGGTVLTRMFVDMGVSIVNMLHGEQDISTRRPLCAGETVTIGGQVESIDNKPDKRMTVIRERTVLSDAKGAVADMWAAYVYRWPKAA